MIRPLAYCAERDIARYARGREFPIIPCKLCGSQDNMKRREVKAMLASWEKKIPVAPIGCSAACRTSRASHLADRALFDFENVGADD